MQQQESAPVNLHVPLGPIRQNLAEPPPAEVPGDVFDRQRVMVGWNQQSVENAIAFVMGAGGLGNTVALALCRLGIKKMYILDMDYVEATNLNRQLLFSKNDVGKPKVEAAKAGNPHSLKMKPLSHPKEHSFVFFFWRGVRD